ncbi:OmpA family protein [Maribacter sp.]|nr:OmpA family protein [Maribacter sp.]
MKKLFILGVFTLLFSSSSAQSDIENSTDYELLPRLPDYHIYKYETAEFDTHKFFIEGKSEPKEGKKFSISYRHDKWEEDEFTYPTRLQILRNYSQAIVKAGGQIIFERYNAEHGYYSFTNSEQKEIWVQIKPKSSGKNYAVYVIEEEIMRQDITIDAELIKNKIDIDGKIPIYGIYFDLGQAAIKVASEAALVQISDYLMKNPEINCWIVGHTDADGSFEVNSSLSLDRAKAVKQRLEKKYGIAPKRLFAEGVGPLNPVATNTTEEGKTLNRRVELVKK